MNVTLLASGYYQAIICASISRRSRASCVVIERDDCYYQFVARFVSFECIISTHVR